MQLERHQIDLRYGDLRVIRPGRLGRLTASLAREGQREPVVVVPDGDRYVLIDGYQRVAALGDLGADLVEAVVLEVSEADGLVLAWRLETGGRRPVMLTLVSFANRTRVAFQARAA